MKPCLLILSAIIMMVATATPATAQKKRKPAIETFVYHLARQVAPANAEEPTSETVTPVSSVDYTPASVAAAAPAETMIQICITKKNEMLEKLDGLEGRSVKGAVLRIRQLDTIEDISPDCRFLFVQQAEEKFADLEQISEIGIITIGETERFVKRGGAFFVEEVGRKIGFDINVKAANSAGLKPNSKLLQLATKVYDK